MAAKNIAPPPGFDPRLVQPVTSCYTDCAVAAVPLRSEGLKANQKIKIKQIVQIQCTYPAVMNCLHPAAWTLLPADGWTEMTKLLVPGWLQAIFVKCNIALFVGCIWTDCPFKGIDRQLITVFKSGALEEI
jgi:hypothetical protein